MGTSQAVLLHGGAPCHPTRPPRPRGRGTTAQLASDPLLRASTQGAGFPSAPPGDAETPGGGRRERSSAGTRAVADAAGLLGWPGLPAEGLGQRPQPPHL